MAHVSYIHPSALTARRGLEQSLSDGDRLSGSRGGTETHSHTAIFPVLLLLAAALIGTGAMTARAGGGPLNTLVVVNDASADSLEIGLRYAKARGIPESHICHVYTATSGTITLTAWSNQIRNPVLAFVGQQGLSNQIDYVVFAHAFPFRVWNTNIVATPTNWLVSSLTSCMYYDFYASSNAFAYGCHLNKAATNRYFGAERAFRRAESPNGRYLISALLTGFGADDARAALKRAATADGRRPAGRIDLLRTSDGFRSIRWPLHEEADARSRQFGRSNEWFILTAGTPPVATNRLGYQTGLANVPDVYAHQYVPGAYADHLTSYGAIFEGPNPQTVILHWLKAGCAGSYGTVVEPCAFTEKFPDPLLYVRYERGFTLGESLYMSVSHPYQGLFVGDPLVAPYAQTGHLQVLNLFDGQVVSGVITVQVAATTADGAKPISVLDAFVDGRWAAVVAKAAPLPGNEIHAVLPDGTASYVVQPGDDLYACASGLAAAVASVSTTVQAAARGDTVELRWASLGVSASNVPLSAWAFAGSAPLLTITALTTSATFQDPPYQAHEVLPLRGYAESGDYIVAKITLTNGVVVTNIGYAESNMGAIFLLLRLQGAINSNPALQGVDGVHAPYLENGLENDSELVVAARFAGVEGTRLFVDYSIVTNPGSTLVVGDAFQDYFNDNEHVMRPRATIRLAEGLPTLSGEWALDTTTLPNGPVRLDFVAHDGTAVRAQTRAGLSLVVSNSAFVCRLREPPAFRHVLRGTVVTAVVETADAVGLVTQIAFYAEGKLAGTASGTSAVFVLQTTNCAIGIIHLEAVARTDAGKAARSEGKPLIIYTDVDVDGLADTWEIDHFDSITNAVSTASADPDGDGFSNLEEFYAGTDPGAQNSLLAFESIEWPVLKFQAVSSRNYRIWYAEELSAGVWTQAMDVLRGSNGLLTWLEGTTNSLPPNAMRFYRVESRLP